MDYAFEIIWNYAFETLHTLDEQSYITFVSCNWPLERLNPALEQTAGEKLALDYVLSRGCRSPFSSRENKLLLLYHPLESYLLFLSMIYLMFRENLDKIIIRIDYVNPLDSRFFSTNFKSFK